jgi:hypothetical protein
VASFCDSTRPNHLLWHLLDGLFVELMAFLKEAHTGKHGFHPSGDNVPRWLDDDGYVVGLEDKPKDETIFRAWLPPIPGVCCQTAPMLFP